MKLFRFGQKGSEKPGVLHNDIYLDLSDYFEHYNQYFFENNGLVLLEDLLNSKEVLLPSVTMDERVTIGPPVASPSKIVCIGLNYADHAKETGAAFPLEPIVFLKATTAISGPFDEIIIPKNSQKTDWKLNWRS